MRVIGSIEDPSVIRAILEHLGLWLVRSRPPPKIHDPPVLCTLRHRLPHPSRMTLTNPTSYRSLPCGDPQYSWDDYIQA